MVDHCWLGGSHAVSAHCFDADWNDLEEKGERSADI
jgi:hypothetical protein